MRALTLVLSLSAGALLVGCASGRVRGGQGTEIRQEEVYQPKTKVEPPEGNSARLPETYPLMEVDLDRKTEPYAPEAPEPE